jgi:hypothetical protein
MMSENWRGDNRRRKSSRRGGEQRKYPEKNTRGQMRTAYGGDNEINQKNAGGGVLGYGGSYKKDARNPALRSKWTSVKQRTDPIPTPLCPYCNEPIKDLASAIADMNEKAVHFECVQKRISAMEKLAKGDTVAYIGGGRFGIVAFENPQAPKSFRIKKIIEWEQKDKRADWRTHIADHFSLT